MNDAFGTAHRAHASTEGVTKFLNTSVAGFLLQKELDYLGERFCLLLGSKLDQGRGKPDRQQAWGGRRKTAKYEAAE